MGLIFRNFITIDVPASHLWFLSSDTSKLIKNWRGEFLKDFRRLVGSSSLRVSEGVQSRPGGLLQKFKGVFRYISPGLNALFISTYRDLNPATDGFTGYETQADTSKATGGLRTKSLGTPTYVTHYSSTSFLTIRLFNDCFISNKRMNNWLIVIRKEKNKENSASYCCWFPFLPGKSLNSQFSDPDEVPKIFSQTPWIRSPGPSSTTLKNETGFLVGHPEWSSLGLSSATPTMFSRSFLGYSQEVLYVFTRLHRESFLGEFFEEAEEET